MSTGLEAFGLMLYSEHMKTQVVSRPYSGTLSDEGQIDKIHCTLKKDMFIKFFSLFKLLGSSLLKMSNAELIELEFYCEKSPFFIIHLEAGCREF